MTIPDFQTIMLPLLKLAGDKEVHKIHDVVGLLASEFSLSDDEKSELLPSGQQPVFYNRVGWARTYLKKAGLIEDPRRGYFIITEKGRSVLEENPTRVDMHYLERFPEYVEFRRVNQGPGQIEGPHQVLEDMTPEEALEDAYQRIRKDLSEELLKYILNSSSGFFEKLVVDLVVKMGYGGSHRNVARAVGQRGDEGIDGVIDEDRLGLDIIYIQAKKWKLDSSVGRPEIHRFVGALQGQRAKKGIFITTTKFTNEARAYTHSIETKVVLIDGSQLTDFMIDYGVGVTTRTTYEIKSIDIDYFGESPIN